METQVHHSVVVVESPDHKRETVHKIKKRSTGNDPTQFVIKELLEPYMKYKAALEVGEDMWLPALVARYEDRETPNRDLPVLRSVAELVSSLALDTDHQEVIIQGVYEALKQYGRDIGNYQSSTEQAAFRKMEQERKHSLMEMEKLVHLLDKAITYLPSDLKLVIEKTYMVPDPLSQQEITHLIGVDDERTVRRKKRQAIERIAEFLFPQTVS